MVEEKFLDVSENADHRMILSRGVVTDYFAQTRDVAERLNLRNRTHRNNQLMQSWQIRDPKTIHPLARNKLEEPQPRLQKRAS